MFCTAYRLLNARRSTPGTINASSMPLRRLREKKLIVTGISTDTCLAFPAIAAVADGFQSYAVIDASGGFSQAQVDMGILRMQQAGVVPVGYSNVPIEILADNAAPEAEAVYAALSMPFSTLVFGLRQYYSQASVDTRKKVGA